MRQNQAFVERAIVASESLRSRYRVVSTALVFAASTAVVAWQTSRFVVLWDVSYILENASRIAGGDVPYRDFPFPYAPLTFLVQATIVRVFGRAYWHHAIYAALTCGAASAFTLAIVRRLVHEAHALFLSGPLAVLGIYCILPHPFYDPDCCLAILLILGALAIADDSILIGAMCIVPLFVKQNIGLAFAGAALLLFAVERRWRSVAGLLSGALVAAGLVAAFFGAENYVHWTVQFAAQRRLPPLTQMLSVYNDADLWWWTALVLAGIFVPRARWLIAIPFLWIELRFFLAEDPLEPEENLLRMWPLFIVIALIVGVMAWRRERGFIRILPFMVLAAIQGAFLSQVVWGSTYGIWPLLVILIAIVFRYAQPPVAVSAIVCAVLLHHGAWYIANNRRLSYAKWDAGETHRSTLPALRGLTMRGEWLPEFENLIRFTDRAIPRDDGILFLPGEDLFYFTTGRKPQFPVLMFDATVNPYSPAQIAALVAERRMQWVIVKERLQINGTPDVDLVATLRQLRGFRLYAALPNYAIFSSSSATSRTDARGAVAVSKRTRTGS